MKILLLMRHAKSSWDEPGLADVDRPLNARGRRDAPRMGQWLMEQKLVPDHVVTSAAVRAHCTAELVAAACDRSDALTVVPGLYHADVDEWNHTIARLSPAWNCVLCVGHNPGLEEFIGSLTLQYPRMRTAAIAHLTCDVARWEEFVDNEEVNVRHVWSPKELN